MHEFLIANKTASATSGAITAALMIFLGSYALIISERVHRSIVAIFGGSLMIILGIFLNFYDQDTAFSVIDFNTIGLLVGMMIIIAVAKDTGMFQYIAIKAAKLSKGDPWMIMIMFALITAVFSAFLDNVTTIILMVPMTFVICDNLRINPIPFLLVEIFMSNIGGTATLIGDPPNILIGSAAKLSFVDFLTNLGPIVVVMLIVILPIFRLKYGKNMKASRDMREKIMKLNEQEAIKDLRLLKKSLFVLGVVTLGFFLHGFLNLEAATIAIFGAGLLLFLDNKNPERVFHEVEWTTIFFFIGLFVIIGGLEQVGIIKLVANKLLAFTGGDLTATVLVVLWGGAILSAFIDNIPFVVTMIPLVHEMGETFANLNPIWWSLALGACLGGNGTLIGASANLVVAGMAERSGYKISFLEFIKMGMLIMFVTVFIANVYILFRYL